MSPQSSEASPTDAPSRVDLAGGDRV